MKYIVDVNAQRHDVIIADGKAGIEGQPTAPAELSDIEGSPIRMIRIGDEVFRVVAEKGMNVIPGRSAPGSEVRRKFRAAATARVVGWRFVNDASLLRLAGRQHGLDPPGPARLSGQALRARALPALPHR